MDTPKPRVSVIEITFDDGSSDTIQLFPNDGESLELFGWTRRRDGRTKNSGAYTLDAIATYLYETAVTGDRIDFDNLDGLGVELQKAYELCRGERNEPDSK